LRGELCRRAADYATGIEDAFYISLGASGVVLFSPNAERGTQGNFQPASHQAILATPGWARRLTKSHAQRARALPSPHDVSAREMDSCTSSDALLMNIMCYPGAISGDLSTLLGVANGDVPHFGVPGAVPLADGSVDSTEVDMRIGHTNFEEKLTESSFTTKSVAAVERARNCGIRDGDRRGLAASAHHHAPAASIQISNCFGESTCAEKANRRRFSRTSTSLPPRPKVTVPLDLAERLANGR
jgi:hypothetical protein